MIIKTIGDLRRALAPFPDHAGVGVEYDGILWKLEKVALAEAEGFSSERVSLSGVVVLLSGTYYSSPDTYYSSIHEPDDDPDDPA